MVFGLLCGFITLFFFVDGRDIPPGYNFYNEAAYYKFHADNITWFEAKKVCSNETVGGSLAFPTTTVQYSALSNLMSENKVENIWLGISDLSMKKNFTTVTGEKADALTPLQWSYMQPDTFGGSYGCVEMDYHVHGLILRDCDSAHPFACQLNDGRRFRPQWMIVLVAVAVSCLGWFI